MAEDKNLDAFKETHEEVKIDADRKLRIGFIGCGWIAGSHIKSLLKQPDVEIQQRLNSRLNVPRFVKQY